jgi:hypothetical protein
LARCKDQLSVPCLLPWRARPIAIAMRQHERKSAVGALGSSLNFAYSFCQRLATAHSDRNPLVSQCTALRDGVRVRVIMELCARSIRVDGLVISPLLKRWRQTSNSRLVLPVSLEAEQRNDLLAEFAVAVLVACLASHCRIIYPTPEDSSIPPLS